MTNAADTTFGPYQLLSMVGQGAMGEVWHAFDTRRERHVALKLLPDRADVPAAAHERVHREAQLAGQLSSAHVVPIHDFGWIDGKAFLDMRLVAGGDLAQLLRAHPRGLELHRAARIVTQIADALDAAHTAGLVHCDVKPSNVLLDTTATGDFCYLADFGIATLARTLTTRAPGAPVSTDLQIVGTPTYMAPELFAALESNERPSVASDVYALGVLLYELLTGHPPFEGIGLPALVHQHTQLQPPRISTAAPALAALEPIIDQALAKHPDHRYPSAGAFAAAVTTAITLHAIHDADFSPATDDLDTPATNHAMTQASPDLDDVTSLTWWARDDSLEAVFLPLRASVSTSLSDWTPSRSSCGQHPSAGTNCATETSRTNTSHTARRDSEPDLASYPSSSAFRVA